MSSIIRIGFTKTDRANDYVPSMDGYRPGAEQEYVSLDTGNTINDQEELADVAECVFMAMNAPDAAGHHSETVRRLHAQLLGSRMRSLSVGDTVSVPEEGWTVECARAGWKLLDQNP